MKIRCPHCHNPVEVVEDDSFKDVECTACGSSFSLVAETADYRPNQRTIAHFDLGEKLGFGAFGAVWKARDTKLDRDVAIKIPRQEQLDEEGADKFLREARAAAQLNHPSIVSVHEVGRADGQVYIVSDYVEGVTLASWLTAERPAAREAALLCVKICEAVQHAHEKGVIHRDLKPGNIMLDNDGEPHVMDFGLAKREAGEITITMEGARLGTPAYMPPEQLGKAHEADARSDVYSLGVILYELLTGELPFRGDQAMLLHQLLNDEAPSPRKLNSKLGRDLETITLKCLRKEQNKRYSSAQGLADDLRRWLDGMPIAARPASKLEKTARWCRRNATAVVTGCLIVAGLFAGTLFYLDQQKRALAKGLVEALLNAETRRVPDIIDDLKPVWTKVRRLLVEEASQFDEDSSQRLHIATALVDEGAEHVELLGKRLPDLGPARFLPVRKALSPYAKQFVDEYWKVVDDQEVDIRKRCRTAIALAAFDTQNKRWNDGELCRMIAEQLAKTGPAEQTVWSTALLPVRKGMVEALRAIYLDSERPAEQVAATHILVEYLANDPQDLFPLALDANENQFFIDLRRTETSQRNGYRVGRSGTRQEPRSCIGGGGGDTCYSARKCCSNARPT